MDSKPCFVDMQVNGYAGIDFNANDLSLDQLHFACEQLREDGVAGILATIITAEVPKMAARLRRIADICQQDPLVSNVVWGLHMEGPFINETPGYISLDPPQHVRPGDVELMKTFVGRRLWSDAACHTRAGHNPGLKVTRWLAGQQVLVSAGHCDPSINELHAAIDAGLSLITHLGNGCPLMMCRHDNIIQRVLSLRERLTICFIADGVHVPPAVLGNYLQLAGMDRSIVVSECDCGGTTRPRALYSR